MPRYMKKPYKHGGKTVPGMFKGSDLPKAQSNIDWQTLFGPPLRENPSPEVASGPPRERSWLGNIGTRIGNIFRPSHKDLDPRIKGQLLHPPKEIIDIPGEIDPNIGIWGQKERQWGPKTWENIPRPEFRPRKRGGSFKRKGGSTGPNGML